MQITKAWFFGFVAMVVSSGIGAFFPAVSVPGILLDTIVPIAIFIVVIVWQRNFLAKFTSGEAEAPV